MLCIERNFKIELSRKIVLWQIFIGHSSASFPLLCACRLAEFESSEICHVSMYCYGSFLLQDILFKSPRIFSQGTKHEIYREHVAYRLQAHNLGRYSSRMSYFVLVRFSSRDAVALLRESYTFV